MGRICKSTLSRRRFRTHTELVREREVQAGSERDVVPFDWRNGRQRMSVKYIRERHLPAQPLVNLSDVAEVHCPAHDAHIVRRRERGKWNGGGIDVGLAETRIEQEALRKDAVRAEFVHEIVAHS